MLVLGQGWVQSGLGDGGVVLASLQEERLNERDVEQLDRGYYEGLLERGRLTDALWTTQIEMPEDWLPLTESGRVNVTGGAMQYELVPSHHMVYHRAPVSTNRWGMRDQEYPLEKPPDTYRIALLGASYEMGSGVPDGKNFESLVEARLNEELGAEQGVRFEILNFAVGGYSVLQHVELLKHKVPAFQPDIVLCTGHSGDAGRALHMLMQWIEQGVPLPPALEDLRRRAGVERGMSREEYRRRLTLEPFGRELLTWGYRQIVELTRAMGAVPLWVFVPRTDGIRRGEEVSFLVQTAREAGFQIINLDGAYGQVKRASIQLAPWEAHPNEQGHALLAQRLFEELVHHQGDFLLRREAEMKPAHFDP
ncbi:MAG: hypothetical protein D6746_03920 [Bacteroidetes bacterium]|nr:MAG: hypothetical protein D6746_03920 [Bacteroidota bacterium]